MLHSFVSEWNTTAAGVWAALFNSLPAVCILTGCVWLLLDRVKGWSAATRYAGWCGLLAMAVVLPVAQYLLPHKAEVIEDSTARVQAVSVSLPVSATPVAEQPILSSSVAVSEAPQETPAVRLTAGGAILLVWLLAIAVQLTRLGFALRQNFVLKRSAMEPEAEMMARWRELLRSNDDIRRPVTLAISAHITMPAVVGYLRPVVMLPPSLAVLLNGEEMDGVLLHELAHVRRRDDWAIAAQRFVEAVFALHPLVHLIGSKMELQREIACDDWVLQTQRAPVYASSLTSVAEYCLRPVHSGLMGLAMEQPSQLGERVELLLDSTRSIATRVSWRWVGSFVPLLSVACLASLRLPTVMAFPVETEEPAKPVVAVAAPVPMPVPVVTPAPVIVADPVVVPPQAAVHPGPQTRRKDEHATEQSKEIAREQAELSAQQRELGRKQAELVRRQMELARKQMAQAHVQLQLQLKQNLEPQMRHLQEQLSHMNLDQTIRSAVQAQVQADMMQANLAHLDALKGLHEGDWMGLHSKLSDEERNKIRAEQKRYEAQAAELGAKQAQAAREFRDRVNQIVKEALSRDQAAPKK